MEMNNDIFTPPTCPSLSLLVLRMPPSLLLSKKKSPPRLPASPQTQSGCPDTDH